MSQERTTNTQRPQPVDGRSADGAYTAELGSEGGSYGELAQPGTRAHDEATHRQPGRGRSAVMVGLLVAVLAVAVYLATTVGACWQA